jgi:hypothetical protein
MLGKEGFDPAHHLLAWLAPASQVVDQPRIAHRQTPERGMAVSRR